MGDFWRNTAREMVLNRAAASPLIPTSQRWRVLRALGMDVGKCALGPYIYFRRRWVSIGPRSHINRNVFLECTAPITIGAGVGIGPWSMINTSAHEMGPPTRRPGRFTPQPVVIGDGAWIGARSTLLPGVTIGPGAVIGAGSVVNRDCDANAVYAGVPARLIRRIVDDS